LARRADTFSKLFTYLDRFDRPVTIVETGCVREEDGWDGDGQSTILFDKYALFHPGSVVFSVDINPAATALCRSLVGPQVHIHTGDSVAFLKSLTDDPPPEIESIDLLYLDSYDVDLHDPLPSAIHTLKELVAIVPLLSAEGLVVVDDSPLSLLGVANAEGSITPIGAPRITGKGRLIAEYARQIGTVAHFVGYQCGWIGFGRRAGRSSPMPGQEHDDPAERGASERPRMNRLDLAWRMTDTLPRADRARLALRLLESEAEEVTFRRGDTRWTAFPWDHTISGQLFVDGNFQEAELRAVLSWLRRHRRFRAPRDMIVDIGANIGTSTIPLALRTQCRVIAIEPVPEIFAALCRNVADNGLSAKVTCVQAAITTAPVERVRMILPAVNGGAAEISRGDREPSFAASLPIRGFAEVPAKALSDVLESHGVTPERVAFVWSDTQGWEAEVIDSGRPLWAAGVPLFAEFAPTTWRGPGDAEALLAAASANFAGFIPARNLVADEKPRPMAELPAFSRRIGPEGADVLLLPQSLAL
jgi:FkbM family methyltransferase